MKVKEEVLKMLEDVKPDGISGEEMAEKIGVSRNAVWKAINSLKEDGHDIISNQKSGYSLAKESDIISEAGILKFLRTEKFGRKIVLLEETDSTNNYAKKLADRDRAEKTEDDGTIVVADHQTSGKGRLGRQFFSPEKSGIYMSLILRPDFDFERAGMITSMAAVAVANAIEKVSDAETKIKWVNDIFINNKKICGILTEASTDFETKRLEYAVVGIGINVKRTEFPEYLKDIASSVENECREDVKVSRNELIAEVLNELEIYYGEMEKGSKEELSFLEISRKKSILLGKTVRVLASDGEYEARAVEIDSNGRLIVENQTGKHILNSGEVSIRF